MTTVTTKDPGASAPSGAELHELLRTTDPRRRRTDVTMRILITAAFAVAMIPLVSLTWTVVSKGAQRLDGYFLLHSMRGVFGGMDAGGIYHAIAGTLLITLAATVISVPIGLMTAIYLVEYGRGWLAKAVTFFVDVMTGIPSIVAGLFAYALFAVIFGPGVRMGIVGAVALSVLMIPVVVRSSEEMLRLVPNELREASLALGVPRWLTVIKVVLRTSVAGLTTGVMLAIARAMHSRCCWPPESPEPGRSRRSLTSFQRFAPRSEVSTSSAASLLEIRRLFSLMPASTFSAIDIVGNGLGRWNTMPT
ncbi:hypothetical protein AGMMS50218_17210 [Actinomycetota bacterium]|nr:hypothetical protein AGMMS50218_17210 [Actinomycetota bacterium]